MPNSKVDIAGSNSEIDMDGNMQTDSEESQWSQLPVLLIWMIKDRLYIGDSARVAFVCKNWKYASMSYSSTPQSQYKFPWVMHRSLYGTECELVNVSTKEKLLLDFPELQPNTNLLYSRRGWLLLRQFFRNKGTSVVLFNIHTNAKITMPDPGESVIGFMACFAVSEIDDYTPKYVVFVETSNTSKTFYLAGIDDKKWIVQSYTNERTPDMTASLLARKHKVYCFGQFGGLLIFDITNLTWTEVPEDIGKKSHINYQWWMMESEEGEVLKIDRGRNLKTFTFYKLNDKNSGWEKLNHSDTEDRSWFLFLPNNHFTVKHTGGTKKVYQLERYHHEFISSGWVTNPKLLVYDLIKGSLQLYDQHQDGRWVDLGWMDKVPPSCKRYDSKFSVPNIL